MGPAELLALVDVGQHDVHAGAHDPQGPGGEHRALVVEAAHQHGDAAAHLADHVLRRHLAVLEHQFGRVGAAHAELVELLGGGEAGHALLDQEGGDAAAAGLRVCLGVDHQDLGVRPVGDPHLGPVEDVAIALALGARAHADHVRARARLAHGERADMLARDQPGQVAGALGGRAVEPQLVDAEVGVRAVAEADRGGGPAHLLHGDAMLQVAEAAAALLLLHRDTEQAEVAEPGPEVARELVARVDLLRARRDLRLREALDRRADHVGGLAQPEVEAGHPVGGHCAADSCIHFTSRRAGWGQYHIGDTTRPTPNLNSITPGAAHRPNSSGRHVLQPRTPPDSPQTPSLQLAAYQVVLRLPGKPREPHT